jgi:hypothetical protein
LNANSGSDRPALTDAANQPLTLCNLGASRRFVSFSALGDHGRLPNQGGQGERMTKEWDDPRLEALDAVSEALKKIYDAKRDGTATANDDIRLKKLHVEWMAIMRKISDGKAEDLRQANHPAAQNESRDSASFLARLKEGPGREQRKWVF